MAILGSGYSVKRSIAAVLFVTATVAGTGIASTQEERAAAVAAYQRGDYTAALPSLRQSAEEGLASAQTLVANMYYFGQGVPRDYAEAARWCRKAADQNYVIGQAMLGGLYYDGRGVPQDYAEAANWYRKAAIQGNTNSQNRLGAMYAAGPGSATAIFGGC